MKYTNEKMKEDDDFPSMTIRRNVLIDETSKIAIIKILAKVGYSWRDLGLGITIRGCQFIVDDLDDNLVMEAHPKECRNKIGE